MGIAPLASASLVAPQAVACRRRFWPSLAVPYGVRRKCR